MLYMPVTTTATPMVLQETTTTTSVPLQATSRYYAIQAAPIIPAVPLFNTTYVYPRYGFVPKPVETSVTKDDVEKNQKTQLVEVTSVPVQHVIHHHVPPAGHQTCAGYCDLCCPWIDHHQHHRYSRRDQYERDELDAVEPSQEETIDERIDRIRRELRQSSAGQRDQSTETVEHHHIHHYPRARSSSLPREPWRSTNQNEYSWRDSHLPAYREATLSRSQTPVDESRTWHESAHERSHRNTRSPTTYYSKKDYVYRPKSEVEAKKWYTQSTGKDADREVQQALRGGTTNYQYNGTPSYDRYTTSTNHPSSYTSNAPAATTTATKVHHLKKIDSTNYHDLYASNHSTLHVVPKHGSAMDPPYMKIINAPATYIH